MHDPVAANRYAQALFEIALQAGQDQAVEDELQALSEALKKSPQIEKTLLNPSFTLDQRKKALERLYAGSGAVSRVMTGFLSVLIEKGRFPLVHAIADAYKRIADTAQGESVAEVTSAAPLDAAFEARLVPALQKAIGTKIALKKSVDPSLVGGISVRVRNKVFDGSVRGQLERLKKELTQREA